MLDEIWVCSFSEFSDFLIVNLLNEMTLPYADFDFFLHCNKLPFWSSTEVKIREINF